MVRDEAEGRWVSLLVLLCGAEFSRPNYEAWTLQAVGSRIGRMWFHEGETKRADMLTCMAVIRTPITNC